MGMYLSLASLSEATIHRLHDDPPLVWQIIAPDDPEAVARARGAPKGPGLLSRLFGRGRPETAQPAPPALELAAGEGELLELDKAWHGIHYLLTGTAWEGDPPLNFLLVGGREVGDEDIGYSVPRTLSLAETRDVAVALAALSDDQLQARFAPGDMMRLEIYPEIWDRNPAEDDTLGYLMVHVQQLRSALPSVVARGHGMLVTLT